MHIFNDFNDEALFCLSRNRMDLANRNGRVRLAVIQTLQQGVEHLEEMISWFKNQAHYSMLGHKDRLNVRRGGTTIRKIVQGWDYLGEHLQKAFLDGALLPSAAARHIKNARAKRR